MKNWLIAATVAGLAAVFTPIEAEAKRFGGGKSSGMQRDMPAQRNATPDAPTTAPTAAAPAAAGATGAAGAAAASRPGWMAPVAGLAAGLGIAALASYLGFGEELANFLMIALLAVAALVVVRLLMRRFAGGSPQLATAAAGPAGGAQGAMARSSLQGAPTPAWNPAPVQPGAAADPVMPVAGARAAAASVPADFDRDGFERIAKMIFIRMQAAHDAADLNDLRQFTTPELFASVRLDLQERGAAPNHTDVVRVDAEVLDVAQEAERQVVSVRFHGLIREEQGADAQPFDEVWHLVKADGANWAIAGIQQRH
ncbi:Tim44-like domain-containing protein [Calidifontimicrobium sp. SYSU G02091]|uniref:Tim44 domain-containing protein n=1 Tax=Calidifontimicrobium sp. SYSU G02091 TaxID=2926421 RepID=UPI001F539C42|nr:Tim44-like domain-containing protein [Calidifontimicrobium sp. SYSU G02091]MCI1192104.1 Tim44-like domain-containing protein [Calidifontimicrobium sp. SYSU G02091]